MGFLIMDLFYSLQMDNTERLIKLMEMKVQLQRLLTCCETDMLHAAQL